MATVLFKMRKSTVELDDYTADLARYDRQLATLVGRETKESDTTEIEFSDGSTYTVYKDEITPLEAVDSKDMPDTIHVYVYKLYIDSSNDIQFEEIETVADRVTSSGTYEIPARIGKETVTLNHVSFGCGDEPYSEEACYVSTEKRDNMRDYLCMMLLAELKQEKSDMIYIFDKLIATCTNNM